MHGHRFDADPDPDPTSVIHKLENHKKKYFYSQQCQFTLFYLSLIISVIGVKIFGIFVSISKCSGKKYSLSPNLDEMDTDPDRQALYADTDPDQEK